MSIIASALLPSCKKREAEAFTTCGIYSIKTYNLTVKLNDKPLTSFNASVTLIPQNGSDSVEMRLKNIIHGYETYKITAAAPVDATFSAKDTVGGLRDIQITAKVDASGMSLDVKDRNTATFLDKKWMIASTTDKVTSLFISGMPDITIKSDIGLIYLPILKKTLDAQALIDSIQLKIRHDIIFGILPGHSADTNFFALLDYMVFSEDGGIGIGVNEHHASKLHDVMGRSAGAAGGNFYSSGDLYDGTVNYFNPLSGAYISDLLDAESEHGIFKYYAGRSDISGLPMIFIETGWISNTIIKIINSFLTYGLYSSLQVPVNHLDIPLQVRQDQDKLVLGCDQNAIYPLMQKVSQSLDTLSWDYFKDHILPGYMSINDLLQEPIFTPTNFEAYKSVVVSIINYLIQEKRTFKFEVKLTPYKNELRPWEKTLITIC